VRWALIAVALAALAASACGGGAGGKRLTRAQLIKRGDAICTRYRQKNIALQKRAPRQSPTDPLASDATVRKAGPILAQLADNLRGARNELSGLKPPKAIEARWKTTMGQYGEIASDLDDAAKAAAAVDRQAVVNSYSRALKANSSLQNWEVGYGFQVCGHASG
jgi:hypothetical protein